MGKRKKQNELDAILEQLKKSYGADVDADLEDSLLESEESERDDELSSVLERIFLENDVNDYAQNDEEEGQEIDIVENTVADDANAKTEIDTEPVEELSGDITADPAPVQSGENEAVAVATAATLENDASSNQDEEQRVDDILSKMFPAANTSTNSSDSSNKDIEQNKSDNAVWVDVLSNREDAAVESGVMSYEDDETVYDDALSENVENDEIVESVPGQMTIDQLIESFKTDEFNVCAVEKIEALDAYDEESIKIEYDEAEELYPESEDIEFEDIEDIEDEEEIYIPRLILNQDEYQFDPLQQNLGEMAFLKPNPDIDYEEPTVVEYEKAKQDKSVVNTLDNNDISLLLKFGYDEEVKTQVGNERTQKIRFDKDVSEAPQIHRQPYGFCGKEISDRTQIKKIANKYKSDKKALMISSIAISAIALIYVVLTVIFHVSSYKSIEYSTMLLLEFIAVAITSTLLGKKLLAGLASITRFEADIYTVLAYIIGEYFLYNIVTLIIYAANPALFNGISLMSFGSIVLIYAAITVLSEFLDCSREAGVFGMMVSADSFYTVEKQSSPDVKVSDQGKRIMSGQSQNNTYKVMKTGLISGYFKKIASRHSTNINLVYIFGVVPVFSMLVGCFAAIAGENIIYGIYSMVISSLLCIPISYVFVAPFIEYMISLKLKKSNSAFVGYGAEETYKSVSTVVFSDNDAIEISSYTEINPNKSASDSKKWVELSCEVFKALGGPLGKIYDDKCGEKSVNSDLIINSISDNGIDIYFKSSANILMGDRQYMLSRNIKVKTDTSLTTAVKGADKSVIYVAFDGQPQVAFIINSKIKSNFIDTVAKLNASDIRVLVSSYEPQINDLYFEQNKMDNCHMISTLKPTTYDSSECRRICDGAIIAGDIDGIVSAIAESGNIVRDRKRAARINVAVMVVGFVWAFLLAFFMSVRIESPAVDLVRDHIVAIFYTLMVIGLIPAAIYTLKMYKKISRKA
jgi:hypothetical protein